MSLGRMSLVDYASDEDEDGEEYRMEDGAGNENGRTIAASSSNQVTPSGSSNLRAPESEINSRVASVRLPDAAALFGGSAEAGPSNPSVGEHASRVAEAIETSRKRPLLNGSTHPSHRPKVARGNSAPVRIRPESARGILVPPQLRGRSNVATEDLDKYFVNRQQRRSE